MQSTTSAVRLTYEDYLQFPDDGRRYEIIDGERYATPAPNLRHQLVSGNLFFRLRSFLDEHPIGVLITAPCDVILGESDIVQPDLLFVGAEQSNVLTDAGVRGAPDLVVEILSESTRRTDLKTKLALYARCGVREYWVVDPELDTVRVHRLAGAVYELAAELDLERGDVLRTPLLPGCELPLTILFPPR